MRKLTYIWHDCFVYETDSVVVVFDFWKDPLSEDEIPLFIRNLDKSKTLYVVVSHHHKDHYTRSIFSWSSHAGEIKYILSKDVAKHARHILMPGSIYKGPRPPEGSVAVLTPGDDYHDMNLSIEAFGSTDIGNSYVVTTADDTLFHAGDLNAWIWKDESTKQEVDESILAYKKVLDTISARHEKFDIAMFPVDSRIGSGYYTGAAIFVERFDVRRFFPMHFCLGETEAQQIRYRLDAAATGNYANRERGEYICLMSPYSCFCRY